MTQKAGQTEIEAKLKAEQAKLETKLRNERTNLRRLFTVAANTFDDIHHKIDKVKDIHVQYNKVVEKAERLFKVDDEIKECIIFTDEEYDTTESYRDRFTEIRVVYEKQYTEDKSSSVVSRKYSHDNLKLPKLSMKEYDLIPRTWVAFWEQFCRIDEDENIREEDKFQYLLSSLKPKTKARDIVESYPPSKDNYAKVIEHLKSRFGRKDLLIEVYIRDLLALVNSKSNIKLNDLYDKLGSYLRALETLGVTTSNYAAMLYPVVESCLPTEILKAWDRYRLNREDKEDDPVVSKVKVLEKLMTFLRHEVEGEEHRFLAETSFGDGMKRKESHKPPLRDEPTAATLIANTSVGRNQCIFCERAHASQDCQKISNLAYEDRKGQVMRKRCCLVCLKPGHIAKRCHSFVKCLICGRRHYALLCPDLRKDKISSKSREVDEEQHSTETLLTNLPSERKIYLKTITVRLRHKNKEVCVRALMDDGSHRSYIEKSLAAELNLSPSGTEVLSQGLFGGGISPSMEYGRFTVTVERMVRKYSTSMSLLDQPKICSTLPRISDRNLIAELASQGIKLTYVGQDTPPIRVLLGADVLGRILTGRVEILASGISAIETLLGWTILGLGKKKQSVYMVTLALQNIELPKIWDLEVLGIKDPIERKNKSILPSFKRPGYASLNECLSVGPSFSEQIPPLLLRFRTNNFGVIADIKQAFLQLSVRTEDRDFLRFLWWDSKDSSKLEFFRHCRVVFGVASSPFLLNASIRHHLDSAEFQNESLQPTVQKRKRGFYVDNLTISVENEAELLRFKEQAMQIMNAASFELRSWAHTGIKHLESQNVLGLKWDTETDELYCVHPEADMGISDTISKRKLLSIVNSIYDPIGFTSPATLLPKLLLQEAWRSKLNWDEELTPDMQKRYQRWAKHLDIIERCRIPRKLFYGSFEKATLHIFTDASAHGYACCAFLRCEEEGEVKISLVSAKARVAPVPRPTIPRLELLGAAIGARIASTIKEALDLSLETYFWTDSMVVLVWVTNLEPWNMFVDIPSRPCDWFELLRSQWWEGPKWLYEPPEFWPYAEITLPEQALVERRKSVAVNLNINTKECLGSRFLYFSSYPRIIRVTAWVLRFCRNIINIVNSDKLTKELSYEEIQRAEEALIRLIQSEWPSDIREKYTQTIQFYEENKILKVRSRLIFGEDPEDFVRPTVLPDHPIVRRLIDYIHQKLHHAGVQTILSHLRERF
ncbi:uncharacterized protein LOC129966468 [Argiope bruennichi]|uniref:uncharacterized protein LOC129966468 n=1 Tax=Argiope bruennichi TaxID=94029 RepID=UPI0024943033|nr:uncharacterized protein LOC129966468 [Argiope bruennichi]